MRREHSVSEIDSFARQSMQDKYGRWGYSIEHVKDQAGRDVPEGGNTVLFRIGPGAMTEPVQVTNPNRDAVFRINVLEGTGLLIRTLFTPVRAGLIELSQDKEYEIHPGVAYSYKNLSDTEDLVLHDEAIPAFQEGDDVDLFVSVSPRQHIEQPQADAGRSLCIPESGVPTQLPQEFYDLVGLYATN